MVKFLKIVTGEEVIAEVTELEGGKLRLKAPVRLLFARDGVGMAPYAPFVKGEVIEIEAKHVLYEGEVEDEVYNAYNSKYGNGIVLAGADAIPGGSPGSFRLAGLDE